jgi:hypothetical protein
MPSTPMDNGNYTYQRLLHSGIIAYVHGMYVSQNKH